MRHRVSNPGDIEGRVHLGSRLIVPLLVENTYPLHVSLGAMQVLLDEWQKKSGAAHVDCLLCLARGLEGITLTPVSHNITTADPRIHSRVVGSAEGRVLLITGGARSDVDGERERSVCSGMMKTTSTVGRSKQGSQLPPTLRFGSTKEADSLCVRRPGAGEVGTRESGVLRERGTFGR